MKPFTYILLLLITISFFFACGDDASVSSQLMKAEELMELAPDSSLTILGEITSPEKLSDRQYALWCLLFTQAQDKSRKEHTTDSLIRVAVQYFEKKKDINNRMKAYYYNATVLHELGDSPQAQYFYLKALETGKETENHALLGRIYANLGSIYIHQNLFEAALEYEKKALDHFSIINDSASLGLTIRNVGRIYSVNNQPDSAIVYYSQALSFVSNRSRPYIYNELASSYRQKKEYLKAFDNALLALTSFVNKNDTTPVFHNLGHLYRLTEQYDSANYYLSRCFQSPNIHTKTGAYKGLALIEEKRQNWPMYAAYQKQYMAMRDSIDQITYTQDLQRIQSLFNYQQVEKEKTIHELKSGKRLLYIYRLVILLCLLSLLLIGSIIYYQRKKRLAYQRYEKEMRLLLQKQHIQEQKTLLDKEESINIFMTSPLYQKIMSENVKVSDEDWNELHMEIEKIYPGFTFRLKSLSPTIDQTNIRLCYLLKIKIPVKQIAHILNLTSQAISKKKYRLCTKLSGEKKNARELDQLLADL